MGKGFDMGRIEKLEREVVERMVKVKRMWR